MKEATETTKISCAVCRDLMPLVQDGIASPESEELVRIHLHTCPACRALWLGTEAPDEQEPPAPDDGKILQKLRRRYSTHLLLLAFDAINGDPLSQQWAVYRAIKYAEKLYPDQTFTWDHGSTGGQYFCYIVNVQSDQSEDTYFPVQTSFWLLTTDEDIQTEPTHTFYVDHRWNTAYRLGEEAAQQASAYLTVQAPELNFASVYGAKSNTVEIDLCYTEQDGMTPANYVDDLPLDAAFDKAMLQKVPSRLCAQILCDGKPTEADMQTVLHTLKQVLESNDMPITYYDITLVPSGNYADHSAYMADVLESGLTPADTIA